MKFIVMDGCPYFEASSPSDKSLRANEHDENDDEEYESGGIRPASNKAEESRFGSEEPFGQGVVTFIYFFVVHDN